MLDKKLNIVYNYARVLHEWDNLKKRKIEKMNSVLKVVVLVSASVLSPGAMFGQMLGEHVGKRVPQTQVAADWLQIDQMRIAKLANSQVTVQVMQAAATIEVTGNDENTRVVFQSIGRVTNGAIISFRAILPDGSIVPMDSWQVFCEGDGCAPNMELWNGKFPDAWQSGQTTFDALIVDSGKLLYVSAAVDVRSCCAISGPIDRADVDANGTVINLTGQFTDKTYATIYGNPVDVDFSGAQKVNGHYTSAKISLRNFGSGKLPLTVSSDGVSATRIVYPLSRPGKG